MRISLRRRRADQDAGAPGSLSGIRRRLSAVPEQGGTVLVLMALLIFVLLGMVGFTVDLGWAYWNRIDIQHGADAAALAGVLHVKEDATKAKDEGLAAAARNGYVDTSLGGSDTVAMTTHADDETAVEHQAQLRATITHEIPTFFMKIFGITSLSISRSAVAEYVEPLPMGSADPYYGNDPELGNWPLFWGNIHGYHTGIALGDRYGAQCVGWEDSPGCTANDELRPSLNPGTQDATGGYVYGVELADDTVGSLLTVELFDPYFTRGGDDFTLVGDKAVNGDPGPTTTFMLYDPDPTPMNTTDGGNTLQCSVTYPARDPYADFNLDTVVDDGDDQDGDSDIDFDDVEIGYPGGVAALWEPFCTILITESGIHPMRVMVHDSSGMGFNRWSIRTSVSAGTAPRVYGLGDMSIFANVDGTTGDVDFYLAEVLEMHAGKDLVIEMWDAGDADGSHSVEIRDPFDNALACTWEAVEDSGPGTDSGSEPSCDIDTSSYKFNNWLVTVRIPLPSDYTCAADCWWTIHYNYPGRTWDTTTWSAWIEGSPVHLVE